MCFFLLVDQLKLVRWLRVAAMGMVASMCTEPIKRRRAEKDLDDKVAAALRERARSRQRTFRTVNSITMRLPRFKDGLRDIKDVFDQYGIVTTHSCLKTFPLDLVFATKRLKKNSTREEQAAPGH